MEKKKFDWKPDKKQLIAIGAGALAVLVLVLGFFISWYLGDLPKHSAWFAKKRNRG